MHNYALRPTQPRWSALRPPSLTKIALYISKPVTLTTAPMGQIENTARPAPKPRRPPRWPWVCLALTVLFVIGVCLGPYAAASASVTYALMSISPPVLGFAAHATHLVIVAALGGFVLLRWDQEAAGYSPASKFYLLLLQRK